MQNIGGRKGWKEVGVGNQGELWAINVKVASRNRLGVVICFGQRAFITYNFFRRFFVCFVLFYFLTFLITCEFKHACILGLFLPPSGKSFFFPFSFFLSFLVWFPVSFVLKFVFPFLVGSYRGLQQFVNKKLFAAVYFTTKSKSAQNIFYLLTLFHLLLLTTRVALDFSNSSAKSPSYLSSHVKNGFKKIVLLYSYRSKLMIV